MNKKRILVIDDDGDFTSLLKIGLEQTGEFDVETENSGAKGLIAARQHKPDLILLDLVMSDKEGSVVASEIKGDQRTQNVPIIFLTSAVSHDEATEHGGVIGGQPIIAKGTSAEGIAKSIREQLAR